MATTNLTVDLRNLLDAVTALIVETQAPAARAELEKLRSHLMRQLQAIVAVGRVEAPQDRAIRKSLREARAAVDAAVSDPAETRNAIALVSQIVTGFSAGHRPLGGAVDRMTSSPIADVATGASVLESFGSGTRGETRGRFRSSNDNSRKRSRKRSLDRGDDRAMPEAAMSVDDGEPVAAQAGPQVECHFRAEMDSEVVVDKQVSVDVTIARHALASTPGRAGQTARAKVQAAKKLIVQIAERRNFRVDGERRVEIDVPAADEEASVSFDATGLTAGEEGELWVQVRQGPVPLVTLKLKPRILAKAKRGRPVRMQVEQELAAIPPPQAPLDELLITEGLVGNDVQYRYFLNLPSLDVRRHFESPVIKGRDDYIVKILNQIGDAWAGTGASQVAAFETALKSIGAMMFSELMPREMQEVLWELRGRIKSVQVFSMEPFIPWELVYLKDPRAAVLSDHSSFLGELGLVRWFYEGYPPLQVMLREGRARYVIPTYPGRMALPLAREEELMMQKLFDAKRVTARAIDVQRLVQTPGSFDLLHFAGHAEAAGADQADACLLLDQTSDGTTENLLQSTTVAQTARLDDKGRRPIVVLNACESGRGYRSFAGIGGFASAFVSRGAGVFIGTHWSVGDGPARTFIETFYKSLAAGGKGVRLLDAVGKARKAARRKGDATWLAYVVYGHPMATFVRSASGD